MSLESTQLRIRLTNNKDILKQLERNKALKTDAKGKYLPIMFDGQTFYFRPGVVLTVGRSVGKAMIRSSAVIMGPHIDGEFAAAVEEVGSFELGTETAPEEEAKATSCPICKQNCHTLPRLSRHLMSAHTNDRADLYPAEDKPLPEETAVTAGDANDADAE